MQLCTRQLAEQDELRSKHQQETEWVCVLCVHAPLTPCMLPPPHTQSRGPRGSGKPSDCHQTSEEQGGIIVYIYDLYNTSCVRFVCVVHIVLCYSGIG